MILDIKKEYQRKVLLSKFDLSENDYDTNQIASFFQNKILSDIRLESAFIDVYLNFFTYKTNGSSGSQFYKKLNEEIKKEVSNKEDAISCSGKTQKLYSLISKSKNNKENEYLVLYLSKKPNNSKFDISQYITDTQYKDSVMNKIMPSIISLTLNCLIAQDKSERLNISKDVFYGNLLLNIIEDSHHFSGFRTNLFFYNNELTFKVSTEEYYKLSKDNVVNGNIVSKKGDYKRADARKTKRLFLNFNDEKYLESKYSTYLYVYEKLVEVFNILGLNSNKITFCPSFIFNDFMRIKNMSTSSNTKVVIEKKNYDILNDKHPNDIANLFSYIHKQFGKKPELLIIDSLLDLNMNNESKYLFLMIKKDAAVKNPIEIKINNTMIDWSNTPSLLADMEYGESAILNKNFLDSYTKIKLENLFRTQNKKDNERPFATQGIIIDEDDGLGGEKNFGNTVYKSLADLYIKDKLFNSREIELPQSNFKSIKVLKKESIKVHNIKEGDNGEPIKKSSKKTIDSYSFMSLIKKEKNDKFEIVDSFIKINKEKEYPQILSTAFGTEIKKDGKYSEFDNYLILIDDKYLIRVSDKYYTPQIIGDYNIIHGVKNPNKLIYDAIDDGSLDEVLKKRKDAKIIAKMKPKINGKSNRADKVDGILSRTTEHEKNLFFPFAIPAFKLLLDNPESIDPNECLKNSLALISFEKNVATFFVKQSEDPLNDKMTKSNLIENVAIFSRNEGGPYKESSEAEATEILSFYLKCMTYNLISSKTVAKKTLLTKMVDILLNN